MKKANLLDNLIFYSIRPFYAAFYHSVFVKKPMELLRQHIKPGEVYRRSDLEYFSTAIDRHLSQLVQEGTLLLLSHGLYHAPQFSKFGAVPPNDNVLVERFLYDNEFLMLSPNSFNLLGLGLTQLYNTTWVYNHKRKGEFLLNGKVFEFKLKSSFPVRLTKEFLLVELLNSFDDLVEIPNLDHLSKKVKDFDSAALIQMAQKYGSGRSKKILKSMLRKKLGIPGYNTGI